LRAGKARIVNDPRLERRSIAGSPRDVQDGRAIGDEVMQRLMGRLNALRAAIGSTLLRLPGNSSPVT
jgi:hypothetical protein